MSLTFHDQFCGAGGSTLGAITAGAVPLVGINHWPVACTTYGLNHGEARIDCADVVSVDPRRYPSADMLLTSPECTHHSYARGRAKDDPSLFDPDGDRAAERSRATMWDVPRFAEVHDYRVVIVENVEAATKWGLPRGRKLAHGAYGPLFAAWLNAIDALGYRHQVVLARPLEIGLTRLRVLVACDSGQGGVRDGEGKVPYPQPGGQEAARGRADAGRGQDDGRGRQGA